MSITVRPSTAFTADLTGAPSALGAAVQCGIRQIPQGTMLSPFASTGIVETTLGGGLSNYTAARTAPAALSELDANGPRYQVVWKVSGVEQPPEDLLVAGHLPSPTGVGAGGYVVTLEGFVPSPRHDGEAWTGVRIEEAASASGPFAVIDTFLLSPGDPDPAQPLPRSVTTEAATLASGWYRVVFVDDEGNEEAAGAVAVGTADPIPSLRDVAALLHQRLNVGGGNVSAMFDDNTSPTATQVQRLIDMWAPVVLIEFGDLSDTALICEDADQIRSAVRTLIAAHVAKVVEVSYWPQDAVAGDTAQAYWAELIDKQLPRVVSAARECRLGDVVPGGDGSAGGGGVAMPARFQFNVGPRVGGRRF